MAENIEGTGRYRRPAFSGLAAVKERSSYYGLVEHGNGSTEAKASEQKLKRYSAQDQFKSLTRIALATGVDTSPITRAKNPWTGH